MVKSFSGKQKYNNSNPFVKIKIREWIAGQFDLSSSVLDVYGGHGLMFKKVWSRFAQYEKSEGDAIKWLEQHIFDIDPYGSPYEALAIIGKRSTKDRIGIVCTDGALRFQGKIRGKLPGILISKCGWDKDSRGLKAAIYYQYPKFLRFVISRIMPAFEVEKFVIKYATGIGKSGTVYWAGLFSRK